MAKLVMEAEDFVPALVQALQHPDVVRILGIVEAPPPEPARMTCEEFRKRMGVSVRTVRYWAREGLPCVRVGRVVRVDVAAADRWLANGGRAAAIEARAQRDAAKTAARHAMGAANGKA